MKASTGFSDLSKKVTPRRVFTDSGEGIGETPPCFLADCMLGRLARWLRILGFDTLYFKYISDEELLKLRGRRHRILLTRDTGLIRSKNIGPHLFIRDDNWEDQIRQVLDCLSLVVCRKRIFSRCPLCNHSLRVMSHGEAAASVPDFVASTQSEFRECVACGKIYWPGTHRRHMSRAMEGLIKRQGDA